MFARTGFSEEFNLQGFIDSQLSAGKKRIVVPPGRYHVTPREGSHLNFKGLKGVTIVMTGVEMDCTETVRALSFANCQNVRLKGLTIDYDPLPYTEGRIIGFGPGKSWIEFQVIEGYPDNVMTGGVEIYDPIAGELRRETGSWDTNFVILGNHRYRIAKPNGYQFNPKVDTEQIGDILVANQHSRGMNMDHAVYSTDCRGLKLEDVTIYASPVFGFLEIRCDDSTYLRCRVDRRPPGDDPVQRGLRRFRSLNADAFHSIEARKGPAIIDCIAKFQGDDCVNIHGTYCLVLASHGNELRIAVARQLDLAPGDPVEFIPYSGQRPPDGKAIKIEQDESLNAAEREYIQKMPLDENIRKSLLGAKARFFKITLDRPVALSIGSGMCASGRVGGGCVVKNCDFGYNRSRGIIIKASHARVIGNKITHGWMTGVLSSPEFFWWLEAGFPDHILIEGNTIIGCHGTGIDVTAPGGDGKPLAPGALTDVIIRGNTISDSPEPRIRVTSEK
jgi:hypothetical protein